VRIFVAGATGVIGRQLVPLLTKVGHRVAGMTRTPGHAPLLTEVGATPVICDVFDREALIEAVTGFAPDAVIHQLTDLPDDAGQIADYAERNLRIRTEGTANLLAAAQAAGASRILVQSIAWTLPGERGRAMERFERSVLDAGGVVVRYGQLYGPGTFYETEPPDPPRISVVDAAMRTVPLLTAARGVVDLTD
jgi:nucleoside-diphosphate-sugar epimerase